MAGPVMRATARVVATRAPDGRTRLPVLRGEAPLLPRRTGPAAGAGAGGAVVHLVGGAAGPLGGDELRLEVEVGPGASLCLRTVAASVALPGPGGAASRVRVVARVAAGGRLWWRPEPLVAAAGCHHAAVSTVDLAEGAELTWREELVCGRHGEPPGDARLSLAVRLGGRTLLQQELAVGPAAAGWAGPAVLAGAGATGSLLRVDPEWIVNPAGRDAAAGWLRLDGGAVVAGSGSVPPGPLPGAVVMPLAGPGLCTTAAGPDAGAVRRLLVAAADRCAGRSAAPALSGPAGSRRATGR